MDNELNQRMQRFERWLKREKDLRETTAQGYAGYISPYLQWCQTLSPDPQQAEDYRHHLFDKELASSTVRNKLFAVERYHEMIEAPVSLSKPSQRRSLPEYLSRDEAQELLFACHKRRDYAMLHVLLYGGLRASECVHLELRDWNVDKRTLRVRDGKGGKDRLVVLGEKAAEAIEEWLRCRGDDPGPLFPSQRGGHLGRRQVNRIVKRWAEEAGIERNVTAHMLRHTFATHALKNGMALTDLQAQLGHSEPKTTLIYTQIVTDGRKEAYDESGPRF